MTAVVLRGDAAHLPLPDGSADLVVTSPPYFGLRSYADGGEHYDGQIGSEATPREYLEALWACTAEWVRVLKPGGSVFVNLGDKYSGNETGGRLEPGGSTLNNPAHMPRQQQRRTPYRSGVGPKSLLGLPWRYAIGCVDRLGLILRRDIIWHKPNGLPESVTDRCRSSHEYVFHLVKQPRYFSAVDEIREAPNGNAHARRSDGRPSPMERASVAAGNRNGYATGQQHPLGKLPGSVWEIPSAPLAVPTHLGVDHFAAYPPELVRRIVLGWSPAGVCTACGEGRRPVSEADPVDTRQWALSQRGGRAWHGDGADPKRALGVAAADRSRRITGYACACPVPDAPARPAVVVDPFAGTGTTMLVASVLGRVGIGIDRSMDYARLAKWRTSDPGERARALGVPKPPPVPDGQGSLFDVEDAG